MEVTDKTLGLDRQNIGEAENINGRIIAFTNALQRLFYFPVSRNGFKISLKSTVYFLFQ